MRVKNISSSTIEIKDLNLKLRPGEAGDLSKHDLKTLRTHQQLNLLFEKSMLANLGRATHTPGTRAALISAKQRIEQLNVMGKDKSVIKKADPRMLNKRKLIGDTIKKHDYNRRLNTSSEFDPGKERYREEFLQNKDPLHYNEDQFYEAPPRQTRIDDDLIVRQLNWNDDSWDYGFQYKGTIKTGRVNPDTTELSYTEKQLQKKLPASSQDYKLYEKAKDKLLRRCVGTTANGKPCKRYATHGFETCNLHMNSAEKQQYKNLRKDKNLKKSS